MQSQNQDFASMIDQTVQTFNGGIKDTTPNESLSLLDQWINRLDNSGSSMTNQIAETLRTLKAELDPQQQGSQPEGFRIQDLLRSLVDQTQRVADSGEAGEQQQELQQLVSTLQHLNQEVSNAG